MANFDSSINALAYALEAKLQQKMGGDCNFVEFIRYYLKQDVQKTANFTTFRDFTIRDFALDKIEAFETAYLKYMCDGIKRDSREKTTNYLVDKFPNHKIENLKADKKMELESYFDDYANRVARVRLNAFKAGKCFREILLLNASAKTSIPILETDFTDAVVHLRAKRNKSASNVSSLIQSQQRQESSRVSLINSCSERQRVAQMESFHALLSGLDRSIRQSFQIKHIKELSKKMAQPIVNGVNKTELARSETFSSLLSEAKKVQEVRAQRACDELLQDELKEKALAEKKRKNKNKSQGKNPLPTLTSQKTTDISNNNEVSQTQDSKAKEEDNWQQHVMLLNHPKFSPSLRCHSRLLRWVQPKLDLKAIRNFDDFNFVTQQWEKKYKDYDAQTLINLRNNHSLVGIERLCSDQEVLDHYTFTYSFVDNNGVEKFGRGFYAIKTFESIKEYGIVYVGIGEDKVIYHAMFESVEDTEICPDSLVKALSVPNEVERVEEQWSTTTQCTFLLDADHVIHMDIQIDKKQGLTYQFYPL